MITTKELINLLYEAGVDPSTEIYIRYLSGPLGYIEIGFNGAALKAIIDTDINRVYRVHLEWNGHIYQYTDPDARRMTMYSALIEDSSKAILLNEKELVVAIRATVSDAKVSEPGEDFSEETQDVDNRVTIEVTFDKDELLEYMLMAHELDITFNQFVELAFQKALAAMDSKGECNGQY